MKNYDPAPPWLPRDDLEYELDLIAINASRLATEPGFCQPQRQEAGIWLVELCHDADGALMGVYKTENLNLGGGIIGRTSADIRLAKRHSCKMEAVYSAMLARIKIGGAWKAVFKTPNVRAKRGL